MTLRSSALVRVTYAVVPSNPEVEGITYALNRHSIGNAMQNGVTGRVQEHTPVVATRHLGKAR